MFSLGVPLEKYRNKEGCVRIPRGAVNRRQPSHYFILLVKISSKNLRKNDAKQLQDLMKLVTGEMGSALNMMEKAKEEGAEDMKPLE